MSGNQQKRIEDLFDELVQLPEAQRHEELLRRCSDDDEVRQEVARLLGSADTGISTADPTLLEHFPKWGIFQDDTDARALEMASIGPYRILEKLGSGGFGTVFKAEQRQPVRRIVALKIIKPGFDTKEVIARFDAERQALARMDHPNIAMVLDAGATAAGRPYFAMEYVAGVAITQFANENKLTIKDRLLLFIEACDAITHAHQKAIIHRDIKASNVLGFMRDGKPHVKVIDFGIAKALTSDRLTEMTFNTAQGMAIGTYESMSPEQAAGSPDVDTRSDVYSLGVLLYHLLTGVPPIDRKKLANMTQAEVRRTICDVEPPTPTAQLRALGIAASPLAQSRQCETDSLLRQLKRELEWIPLKAMRKERERRYASSQQLAEDIQNYLHGRPLIAGPESKVYRLKKLVHQHAGLVSAIAVVMMVLLLGIAATTVEAINERQAEKAARASEARAIDEKRAAEESEARASALAKDNGHLAAEKSDLASQALKAADTANRRLGQAFLERARHLRDDNDNFSAAMTAGFAIGFASESGGATSSDQDPLIGRDSPDGREAWGLSVLSTTPRLMWRSPAGTHHDGPVRSVVFSADGRFLASGSDDQHARIWDAAKTGKVLRTVDVHTGAIQSVSFNPDASLLATATSNQVYLWEVATGAQVRTLWGHQAPVRCVVFSPRGDLIATGSDDQTIRIWNASSEGAPMTFSGHAGAVLSVCFSPDQTILASGSQDHTTRLWNVRTGQLMLVIVGPGDAVNGVSFRPDGKIIASASKDGTVCLWDLQGNSAGTMEGKFGEMTSVCFSPNGKFLAGGSLDHTVRVWDAGSGKLLQTLAGHSQAVFCVNFSPDGKTLASGSGDSRIGLWNLNTGQSMQHLQGLRDIASGVSFSPTGGVVASASGDNCICLWNSRTGQLLQTLGDSSQVSASGGSRFVKLAFSPDGKNLACQASDNAAITVWSVATGKILWTLRGTNPPPNSWSVRGCVTFSPDGKTLASAWDDNSVRLWDVVTGGPRGEFDGHTAPVKCVSFNPKRRTLASGSSDGTIRVWDLETGKTIKTLLGHTRDVSSVSFSPDGETLASGSIDETIRMWDAASGRLLRTLSDRRMNYVSSVCFSPDGMTLASGSADNTIRLWDVANGERLTTIDGSADQISSVCFSPDGRMLASACWDSTISVWDVAQDEPLPPLTGHSHPISSVCFSPNGKMIASGSIDHTARLWDPATGKTIKTLAGHTDSVFCTYFSPDGGKLATASEDKTVKLWDTSTGKLLQSLTAGDGVLCCSISPDGQTLAAGSRKGTIWMWKTSGELARTIPCDAAGVKNDGTYSVCFSPDGKGLVSGSRDGNVRLWDVASGAKLLTFERDAGRASHEDRVNAVCFSPDGQVIASGSYDGAICFWDVRTGKLKWTSNPQPQADAPDGVATVRFSPDGKLLASGSRFDGTIRLWDVGSGLALQTIQAVHGSIGGVFGLSFSPDGNTLAAGSDDNVVGFWNVRPNPNAPPRQYRVPLRQYLEVYQFDGLELKPLPAANLYGGTPFKASTE